MAGVAMLVGSVSGAISPRPQTSESRTSSAAEFSRPRCSLRCLRCATSGSPATRRKCNVRSPGSASRVDRQGLAQSAGALGHAGRPVHARSEHLRLLRDAALSPRAVRRRHRVWGRRARRRHPRRCPDCGRPARTAATKGLQATHTRTDRRRRPRGGRPRLHRAHQELLGRHRVAGGVGTDLRCCRRCARHTSMG